jgi:pimeloyl-ACP methyl ester carboxylesterase
MLHGRRSLLVLAAALPMAAVAQQAAAKTGVLLLHGKSPGSAQSPQMRPLKARLEQDGMPVVLPDMPWSRMRYLDGDFAQALAEVAQHVAQLRAQGATRIVIAGHSMGVPAALAHAARGGDVQALVLMAPGHAPARLYAQRDATIRDGVERARALVAAGRGDARESFTDTNQGRPLHMVARARDYLSYFDPNGEAEAGNTAGKVPASIPVLTLLGDQDRFNDATRRDIVAKLPSNPRSALVEVAATHEAVPTAALEPLLAWLRALPPP